MVMTYFFIGAFLTIAKLERTNNNNTILSFLNPLPQLPSQVIVRKMMCDKERAFYRLPT